VKGEYTKITFICCKR